MYDFNINNTRLSNFSFITKKIIIVEQEGDEDDIGPKLSEAAKEVNSEEREPDKKEPKEPVLLTRDENLRSHSTQREWDKGKESK